MRWRVIRVALIFLGAWLSTIALDYGAGITIDHWYWSLVLGLGAVLFIVGVADR